MPETLSPETFEAHLRETFQVVVAASGPEPIAIELELVEVERLAESPPAPGLRIPFSLIFEGSKDRILPQGIYTVQRKPNDEAGRDFDLFLVPILSPGEKQQYQVVFN